MKFTDQVDSKTLKITIIIIGASASLIFVFGLGVFVGAKRADLSFEWAQAYHKNFGGPSEGFLNQVATKDFTNSNGVFGQIIKITPTDIVDQSILTIKETNNIEKAILVNHSTSIVSQRNKLNLSQLDIDDSIVAIGIPNSNGQIVARLIRVMPSMPKR